MKSKIISIFILTFLISNCKKENLSLENNLRNLIFNFSENTSISYSLDYKMKYFDYPDTINTKSSEIIIREKSDSLFGGYIWHHRKDSTTDYIKYYDLTSFYIIDNKTKKVTRFNPKEPIPYGFTGNFDGDLLNTYFLKYNGLYKFIEDSIYNAKISKNKESLSLKVFHPDEVDVKNKWKEIYFDDTKNAINKIVFRAELDSLYQYNEWNLSAIKFNNYTAKDLADKFVLLTKNYEFTEYQSPSKEENLPLLKGQKVTNFKGEFLNKNNFVLSDFYDNIIILDFWYKNCPPCIKSIPQLNNIYKKYKSKNIKLFGINDVDVDSISRENLLPFIKNMKIMYPTIIVNQTVSNNFKVKGYPTFYIINKKGEVQYSKLGYSEFLEKEVDSVLKQLLK
ncbi:TlpA family protein disulfide reductase [Polaribacter gangjinensis]|uniref:Thioredoxin domain-containing protein n=1 Tax=Polaribacter gangjinensis TaxID=574710 RepID=A0A2S7WBK4_9FLAO|nr:TlpA disulfide reductase family protein [Polaribacter gangjinensis]PQJ75003.1 hypothetical protein BTO13_06960 [Polaribacter gangjinensis]